MPTEGYEISRKEHLTSKKENPENLFLRKREQK